MTIDLQILRKKYSANNRNQHLKKIFNVNLHYIA